MVVDYHVLVIFLRIFSLFFFALAKKYSTIQAINLKLIHS